MKYLLLRAVLHYCIMTSLNLCHIHIFENVSNFCVDQSEWKAVSSRIPIVSPIWSASKGSHKSHLSFRSYQVKSRPFQSTAVPYHWHVRARAPSPRHLLPLTLQLEVILSNCKEPTRDRGLSPRFRIKNGRNWKMKYLVDPPLAKKNFAKHLMALRLQKSN